MENCFLSGNLSCSFDAGLLKIIIYVKHDDYKI